MNEIKTDSKPTNEQGEKSSEHQEEKQDEDKEPLVTNGVPGSTIETSKQPDQPPSNSVLQVDDNEEGKPDGLEVQQGTTGEQDNEKSQETELQKSSNNEEIEGSNDADGADHKIIENPDQILSNSEDQLQNTDEENPADSNEKDDKVRPEQNISSNETSSVTDDAARETSKPETEQIQNGEKQLGPQVQKSGTKVKDHDKETDEKDTPNPIQEHDHSSLRGTNYGGEKENPMCQMLRDIASESIGSILDMAIESFKEMIQNGEQQLGPQVQKSGTKVKDHDKEMDEKVGKDTLNPIKELDHSNLRDTNNGGGKENPTCQMIRDIASESFRTVTDSAIIEVTISFKEMTDFQLHSLLSMIKEIQLVAKEINKEPKLKMKYSDPDPDQEKSNVISEGQIEHQIINVSNSNGTNDDDPLQNDKPSGNNTAVMSELPIQNGEQQLSPQVQKSGTKVKDHDKETDEKVWKDTPNTIKELDHSSLRYTNNGGGKENPTCQMMVRDIAIESINAITDVTIEIFKEMIDFQRNSQLPIMKDIQLLINEINNEPELKMKNYDPDPDQEKFNVISEGQIESQIIKSSSHSEELKVDCQDDDTHSAESKESDIKVKNNGDQEHCNIADVSNKKKAEESLEPQNEPKVSCQDIQTEIIIDDVKEMRLTVYKDIQVTGHDAENKVIISVCVPMLKMQEPQGFGESLGKEEKAALKGDQETNGQSDASNTDVIAKTSEQQIQSGEVNEAIEQSSIETIEEKKSVKESNDANEDLNEEGSIPEDVTWKEPLHFHSIHGANIQLSDSGFRAQRKNSSKFFGQGITFSSRPIAVKEKIYIQLEEISDHWVGCLTFGFTNYNPNTLAGQLPGIIITDLEKKPGYWAGHLAKTFCRKNDIFHYYVNSTGTIFYGINGIDKGTLFWSVDTTKPLWAMIDIFGYFTKVRLLDCRTPINTINIRTPISNLSIPRLRYQNSIQLIPLKPHTTTGKNVKILDFKGVAARSECLTNQGYVFTNSPMRPGQTIVIQILCTGPGYEFLPLGLTCCDPTILDPSDLPDSAEALVEWGQNWVVFKNVANFVRAGDELAVTRTLDGDIRVRKNNGEPITLMRVDRKLRFWMFLEMYGAIRKIRMWTTISRNDRIFVLRKSLSSQTI